MIRFFYWTILKSSSILIKFLLLSISYILPLRLFSNPKCIQRLQKKRKKNWLVPFSASDAPSFLLLQFQFIIGLLLILCEYIAPFISWTGRDPFSMVDVLIGTYHLLCKGWNCWRDFGQFRKHLVMLLCDNKFKLILFSLRYFYSGFPVEIQNWHTFFFCFQRR